MSNIQYAVYILTNNRNTVLYIGMTNNLTRRIYEHKQKLIDGFTKNYKLNKLVYYVLLENPENAIRREKYLKNLLRRKKERIINKFNPAWKNLFDEITN